MYSFSPLRDHVSHILGVALRVAVFLYTVLQVLVASVCLWAVASMRKVVVVWSAASLSSVHGCFLALTSVVKKCPASGVSASGRHSLMGPSP